MQIIYKVESKFELVDGGTERFGDDDSFDEYLWCIFINISCIGRSPIFCRPGLKSF